MKAVIENATRIVGGLAFLLTLACALLVTDAAFAAGTNCNSADCAACLFDQATQLCKSYATNAPLCGQNGNCANCTCVTLPSGCNCKT